MQTTSENFKPAITCIYVNYRSKDFLARSLESLFQFETSVPFEVIIVNNDGNEQQEVIELARKFGASVIAAPENPGFGTAGNRAAEQAKGELLFFVNPDTKWKEPFFQSVMVRFNDTRLGVVGIQLVSQNGSKEKWNAGKALDWRKGYRCLRKDRGLDWVSGGALFVRKEDFLTIGGFDERFFLYFEDMDFCYRMRKLGFSVQLHDEAQLIHFGGQSHTTKFSQKKYYDASLYQYTKKNWPLFPYLFFRIAHPLYRFLFPYGRS